MPEITGVFKMEDIDKRLKDMILDIKQQRASIKSEKSEIKEQERSLKELEDGFMSLALKKFGGEDSTIEKIKKNISKLVKSNPDITMTVE
jgi:hypothetical protein